MEQVNVQKWKIVYNSKITEIIQSMKGSLSLRFSTRSHLKIEDSVISWTFVIYKQLCCQTNNRD